MSFQNLTGSGNGTLEFRLQIEGFDYEFVTHSDMVLDSASVKRRTGLETEGLQIEERVILPESKLQAQGMSFRISDVDGEATKAFVRQPTKEIQLRESLNANDTIAFVSDASGWSVGDMAYIGTEAAKVTFFELVGNSLTLDRGQLGSISQSFYVEGLLGGRLYPKVYDVPINVERHRVNLYAYGCGDDLQDDGNLIWKGIITEAPTDDGLSYTVQAGPITELLDQEMTLGLGKAAFRGYYFPAESNWVIQVNKHAGLVVGGPTGAGLDDVAYSVKISASGFYETRYELAADLDAQLRAITASDSEFEFVSMGCAVYEGGTVGGSSTTMGTREDKLPDIGDLYFYLNKRTAASAFDKAFSFQLVNAPVKADDHGIIGRDGEFVDELLFRVGGDGEGRKENWSYGAWQTGGGSSTPVFTRDFDGITKPVVYLLAKSFPDVLIPFYNSTPEGYLGTENDKHRRLYFDSSDIPSGINDIILKIPLGEDEFRDETFGDASSINQTDRYVEWNRGGHFQGYVINSSEWYAEVVSKIATGSSFVEFNRNLSRLSPDETNRGNMPFVTQEDLDIEDMQVEFSRSIEKDLTHDRDYIFWGEQIKLSELWQEELKLLQYFPVTTPEGKISIRKFRFGNQSQLSEFSADADSILTDNSYPIRQPNKDGLYNQVVLKTGYSPGEDDHLGPTFQSAYFDSIAMLNGKRKTIEIAPYSVAVDPPNVIDGEEIGQIIFGIIAFLGTPYSYISFDVPMKYFGATLGDVIKITNAQIPNPKTSKRGIKNAVGTLIAKRWDLDSGFGRLTVLISDLNFAGYTPTAMIVEPKLVEGTTYDLDVSASVYAKRFRDSQYFNVGDFVRIKEWNSWNPATGSGEIVSISQQTGDTPDTIRVVFNSSPPSNLSGTNAVDYRLEFELSGTVPMNIEQQSWVYLGSGSVSSSIDLSAKNNWIFGP